MVTKNNLIVEGEAYYALSTTHRRCLRPPRRLLMCGLSRRIAFVLYISMAV